MEAYVQKNPAGEVKPPVTHVGVLGWLRSNLFNEHNNHLLFVGRRSPAGSLGIHRQPLDVKRGGMQAGRGCLLVGYIRQLEIYHFRILSV